MGKLMIYGATGYTGRMAAAHARAAGVDVVLGGRDASRLAALATELGVEHRRFDLETDVIDDRLVEISALLKCAGPPEIPPTSKRWSRRSTCRAQTTPATT